MVPICLRARSFPKSVSNNKHEQIQNTLNPEDLKKQWLPFSILSLLPFLISPSLSSIPSCSFDQFSVLRKHFMFHSVSLLSQAPLVRGPVLYRVSCYIRRLEESKIIENEGGGDRTDLLIKNILHRLQLYHLYHTQ